MINLFVRGELIDLFKSETFAISKAISKLGEINARHGDVSINFKIPTTARNTALFGYLSNLNTADINAFKRYEGQVIENNSVISNGFYQVLKVNPAKAYIELRFYGGNSEWFDLIKKRDISGTYINKSLGSNQKSYSLRDLDNKFEAASIVSSWSNDDGVYYYPTYNGGNTLPDGNFTIDDFQLGIFQHTIFKKIFDSVGIKLKGSLFNDPLYFNTIISNQTKLSDYSEANNNKYFKPINQRILGNTAPLRTEPLNFTQNDSDTQWSGTVFTSAYDTQEVSFFSNLITTKDDVYFNGSASIYWEILYNGSVTESGTSLVDDETPNTLIFTPIAILFPDVGGSNITINTGDTVEFRYRADYPDGNTNVDIQLIKSSDNGSFSSFDYQIVGAITPFDITTTIPEINQADFVKDVMFRHGVISQYDSITRTLTLNKFQDIEKNKLKTVDYTNKLDVSKPPIYDFTKVLSKFKKTTKITYKEDDTDLELKVFRAVWKRGLGDAIIELDNDNLSGESTLYESVFAPTYQNNAGTFYFPDAKFINGGDVNDLEPRIFIKTGAIPVSSLNNSGINSITLDNQVYSNIGFAYFAKQNVSFVDSSLNIRTDTLSFQNVQSGATNYVGNTLLDKNYNLYFEILKRPIHLSVYLNLNSLDIQKIDFFNPVWLKDSYYYLDNVSQYKGDGTTTKVELIKL
jgi:hypothetical protein